MKVFYLFQSFKILDHSRTELLTESSFPLLMSSDKLFIPNCLRSSYKKYTYMCDYHKHTTFQKMQIQSSFSLHSLQNKTLSIGHGPLAGMVINGTK